MAPLPDANAPVPFAPAARVPQNPRIPLAKGEDVEEHIESLGKWEKDLLAKLPDARAILAPVVGLLKKHGLRENQLDPSEVDARDSDTPDAWVSRHPDLVRLTGLHPFNVEPPLNWLRATGFLTPNTLHYVRNHGAAQRHTWEGHRLQVFGGAGPLTLTMDDIAAMPARTIPCLLVCAGNRRKEENMVKKTIGFSWGAAATSTAVWTGVPLRALLLRAGVTEAQLSDENAWVEFTGPPGELPKGEDGSYGTSMKMQLAGDPARDVMVAYLMNGRPLHPDHGFPVRMIIPGFIGGRMIKYVERISVTTKESDNFYHFFDNRVLPSHVDQETADREGWWFKPAYRIDDLNLMSVTTTPDHGELLRADAEDLFKLSGYAYNGGGRNVRRVEVTLDEGRTWERADVDDPQGPTEYGMYWTWFHWSLSVPKERILGLKGGAYFGVRCWDDSQNTQPQGLTWNVFGMMNNSWFRVKVWEVTEEQAAELGVPEGSVWFEHPTRPGNQKLTEGRDMQLDPWKGKLPSGGWMENTAVDPKTFPTQGPDAVPPANWADPKREVAAGSAAASAGKAKRETRGGRKVFLEEFRQHNRASDCWIAVGGEVMDATEYMEEHPGGAMSITLVAGQECTEEFTGFHSSRAWGLLRTHPKVKYIGDLAENEAALAEVAAPEPAAAELLGRLGGSAALRRVVDDVADWVAGDPELAHGKTKEAIAELAAAEKAFLLEALGQVGFAEALARRYAGRLPGLPRQAHARARGYLRKALRGIQIPDAVIAEVMQLGADLLGEAVPQKSPAGSSGVHRQRVVVVGHGPVGHAFLQGLAHSMDVFEVTVLCGESQVAYDRVRMTTYFSHQSAERLAMTSEEEVEGRGVRVIFGLASSIDREAKVVRCSPLGQGAPIDPVPYDTLVLATGSYPFVPPLPGLVKGLPGVFEYRTIDDMNGMIKAAADGARNAVVVGGGLLGLEAAKALHDLGCSVDILEMAPHLMPAQLDEAAGILLQDKIEELGLRVHTSVKGLEVVATDGKLSAVRFSGAACGGEPQLMEVEVLAMSCGIRPRDQLAKEAALELGCRGGVAVDGSLRSSDPAIYAIGEVASVQGGMCYGLWQPGVEQANVLAANLCAGKEAETYVDSDLSTKLKLLGVDVASFGESSDFWMERQFGQRDKTRCVPITCADDLRGVYRRLVFSPDGRKLLGGILVGDTSDYKQLHSLCRSGADIAKMGKSPADLAFNR